MPTFTFSNLKNWIWLVGVVFLMSGGIMGAGVWVYAADESHKKADTAVDAIIRIDAARAASDAAREANENVLRALCINPDYVKSPLCAQFKLQGG